MDNVEKSGLRAGLICAGIMFADVLILLFGFIYAREQIGWFFWLYLIMNLFAFILAGILSARFASPYIDTAMGSLKPGLVAGGIAAVIPAALLCIVIALAMYAGPSQLPWAIIAISMLVLLMLEVAASALISTIYIIITRRTTITIKFD